MNFFELPGDRNCRNDNRNNIPSGNLGGFMKKLTDYMAEELSSAFEKAGYDPSYGKVGVSNRPDLCEYQCNGAMAGAKAYKKAPFMIADDVVANLIY